MSVTITPAQPTDTDTIVIAVTGELPDGCWAAEPIDFHNSGLSFDYDIYAVDGWMPGWGCTLAIVPYQRSDTVGPLPPGYYTVNVREHHESQRDPFDRRAYAAFHIGPCNCPAPCDLDSDQQLTSMDLSRMIDILFAGFTEYRDATCPVSRVDFDCDSYPSTLDMSKLIDHLFAGGAGPCDPCAK